MIEVNMKCCLSCDKPLRGRSDKKFCDDYCRNGFNNRLKSAERPFLKGINAILLKNRKVLESLFEIETKPLRVSRDQLLQKGFRFDFITCWYTNRKGNTYHYCYEYGYLPLEGDQYLVVKRKGLII